MFSAFALVVPHEDARRIRDEVAFFQAVRTVLEQAELFGDAWLANPVA